MSNKPIDPVAEMIRRAVGDLTQLGLIENVPNPHGGETYKLTPKGAKLIQPELLERFRLTLKDA